MKAEKPVLKSLVVQKSNRSFCLTIVRMEINSELEIVLRSIKLSFRGARRTNQVF